MLKISSLHQIPYYENIMIWGFPKDETRYYKGMYQNQLCYYLITSMPPYHEDMITVRYRAVNEFWKERLYL